MRTPPDSHPSPLPRRDFLKLAGVGAGAVLTGALPTSAAAASATREGPRIVAARPSTAPHIAVIGAGVWGSFTALNLAMRGARVTLLDAYGPGNSRATSGDETRGIRSSYGDRTISGDLWTVWARESLTRWRTFDEEHGAAFGTRFFLETGDVILRAGDEPFLQRTRALWDRHQVPYEVLDGDEVRKRWPVIAADDITTALYEPDAGVARARHATQAVAVLAARRGVEVRIARASMGTTARDQLHTVQLENGGALAADAFVFACGPWLQSLFPDLLGNRMRIPLGTVCYFGTPTGDARFTYPMLPSYNFPGVTGWAALPVDNRGFRVRGSIAAPSSPNDPPRPAPPPPDPAQQHPDTSVRWATPERIEGARRFVQARFPLLANAPLLETRACHYESSINRNFIVDRIPGFSNAWIAGVGQAEGFKFAPVAGEYVARRVLGDATDPDIDAAFVLPTDQYEAPAGDRSEEELL